MANKSVILPLKHLQSSKYGAIPDKENEAILHLSDPMVQSFNYGLGEGLQAAVCSIAPMELVTSSGQKIIITLSNVTVSSPESSAPVGELLDSRVLPRQCVESATSYRGNINGTVGWMVNNKRMQSTEQALGKLPIMVKSNLCNLHGMSPAQLLARGEHINDPGGYFIINGSKKIIRLLTAQRRNYPIALVRDTWRQKQQNITNKGIIIQCVARDETTSTNILHYLSTGGAKLQFIINKKPFLVDLVLVLMALKNVSCRDICLIFRAMRPNDTFFIEKVKLMQEEILQSGLLTVEKCRQHIGRVFRPHLRNLLPDWYTDAEVCQLLMEQYVFIHLSTSEDKFNLLCFMACKLYAFVAGDAVQESLDVTSMMEAQLSGFTYLKYLKEKLQRFLFTLKMRLFVKMRSEPLDYQLTDADIKKICSHGQKVGPELESFVTTGNVSSITGIGLMQQSGLSVVLEGLNRMRDLSHLRAIHRGSYFLEMKTVAPRRLTGEAWGFICPVHTPDGAPCGLLNHLSYTCTIPAHAPRDTDALTKRLATLGMTLLCHVSELAEHVSDLAKASFASKYPVLVDGMLAGLVLEREAAAIVAVLRRMKTTREVYQYTEVVLVERRPHGGQYPGLYLFTSPARMMRPVINLATRTVEYIGTFEQMFLNVAISINDVNPDVHTHVEVDKTQMFSNIGKLVPFSDCNPNPRNMYQCQMGKQTMGTPLHNWMAQTYNKVYRLQYPQVPLVRNAHYDKIDMQDYCMGFNAVLAIVSYTGYDIEDAMVLNKSAMERGLAHGQMYKTEFVDLRELTGGRGRASGVINHIFSRDPDQNDLPKFLDELGLPIPGTALCSNDPYYCYFDVRSRKYSLHKYKGESCVVDKVALVDTGVKDQEAQKVSITLRCKRNPTIGDKFASRSGQKGIMSRLYPTEDLPFSERGIMPDIIFNPHGIPSRMTAGKLIELLAGKSAAEFGLSFDSTPFEFNDENPAAEYFGHFLEKAGFNYFGEDIMYSGIGGNMMGVRVYQGIMYYQRLKHMTEDKYQVRSTGAVDAVTRQPVKGRKRGGAIRFGEMERDALIAHGAMFTLKDRLLDCSDSSMEWTCTKCGCVLSPVMRRDASKPLHRPECALCGPSGETVLLQMPHAFKYMIAELASIGISTKLGVHDRLSVGNDA